MKKNILLTIPLFIIVLFTGYSKHGSETTVRVLQSFPQKTFLENLVVDSDETIYFTSYFDGKIYKMKKNCDAEVFAEIEGNISGITISGDEQILVTGQCNKVAHVYHLDMKGKLLKTVILKKASYFLNGICNYKNGLFFIADSHKGVIWLYNMKTGNCSLWLKNFLLESPLPKDKKFRIGVNGLKFRKQTLFVTNTQARTVIKIKISDKGKALSALKYATDITGDDLAIDNDSNIYIATNPENKIVKIDKYKGKTVIVNAEQGAVGVTALYRFSEKIFYAVTNGGLFNPPADGLKEAKVLEITLK